MFDWIFLKIAGNDTCNQKHKSTLLPLYSLPHPNVISALFDLAGEGVTFFFCCYIQYTILTLLILLTLLTILLPTIITYNTYVTKNITYSTIVSYITITNTTNITDTLPRQLFSFPFSNIFFNKYLLSNCTS